MKQDEWSLEAEEQLRRYCIGLRAENTRLRDKIETLNQVIDGIKEETLRVDASTLPVCRNREVGEEKWTSTRNSKNARFGK